MVVYGRLLSLQRPVFEIYHFVKGLYHPFLIYPLTREWSEMMKAAVVAMIGAGLFMAGQAQASEELAKKYNCLACHAVDKKVVGPAYKEVAAKYKGDKAAADKLAAKVKAGGSGVWGAVPMPPNAAVPDADIKKLVTWILSAK